MGTKNSDYSGIYLNYYVMFRAVEPSEVYTPIINKPFNRGLGEAEGLHGIDLDVKGILPALWYCLHLPRNGFETIDLSPMTITKGYSIPHSILMFPSYIYYEMLKNTLKHFPPTVIICDDSCYEEASKFALESRAPLGCVRVSDLSSELLAEHWVRITQLIEKLPFEKGESLQVKPTLFQKKALSALSLSFIANQLDLSGGLLKELQSSNYSGRDLVRKALQLRLQISTLADLEERHITNPTEDEFYEAQSRQLKSTSFPLVITMPGTASRLRPRGSSLNQQELSTTEKAVIEIMGVHRAAAISGVWMDGGILPAEIFSELHLLEDHCRGAEISNKFIWGSMKRIGRLIGKQLGEDIISVLSRTSRITAFTDFPMGIAILPGQTDPLCCIKPISYRTLTPLTRSLQFELPRTGEKYIGKGFKIIIAECLSVDDKIRNISDAGWKLARDMFKKDDRVEVIYSDVQSTQELKELLLLHKADILVISAHGCYENNHNFAGLHIGKDIWLAAEDDIDVPPIVILSACHVAPRGLGAVTVNDLLFRAGAKTVIGTLIPVDVRKNALLTIRFFSYLSVALDGNGQFRTLEEAWSWVVKSNAVNEILATTERLQVWAYKRKSNNLSPIEDFQLNRSRGRLNTGSIYKDTIDILREMTTEDGLGDYFEAVLSSQGFFPESCFYVLSGAPENVILSEAAFERVD